MTGSPTAFDLLDPRLQRWVWLQGWASLRPIQERAIPVILEGRRDAILAAATAAGKTEAAFLPILTTLASRETGSGLGALCISPLKALINDQFDRLQELAAVVGVPVHRWHGDVTSSWKQKVFQNTVGVLIITPESLEALFIRRGPVMARLLGALAFIVVDEIHAFLGSERGRQVQSLLQRVDVVAGQAVPRIALSATLGDLGQAAAFVRPDPGREVALLEDRGGGQEILIQLRGYRHRPPARAPSEVQALEEQGGEVPVEDRTAGDVLDIASDLFERLRGGHHLIFANTRNAVERYSDLLARYSERLRVPNEFWPHHGSLSKDLREGAEGAIGRSSGPATLVCTTTLELGIDIGAIETIAQIGRPPSVASLRQRLGRSGRQGTPAILRVFIQEPEVGPDTAPHFSIHEGLFQTTAMVELLLEGWFEPPPPTALHLSTLVQQLLSLIAQYGGVEVGPAWNLLCRQGPFRGVDQGLFARFLRCLAAADLIDQLHTRELVLGLAGERLVDHHSFYAAFATPEEYRLISGERELGRLPIAHPLFPGLFMIFAGRRWRVAEVDQNRKVVELAPAAGGRVPTFEGGGVAPVHDRVRQRMLELYRSERLPAFLDGGARGLIFEGREWFRRHRLGDRTVVAWGDGVILFPWTGDRALGTLALWLASRGLDVTLGSLVIEVENHASHDLARLLEEISGQDTPDSMQLAAVAKNKVKEKFHPYLDEFLLEVDYASSELDLPGAREALRRLVRRPDEGEVRSPEPRPFEATRGRP